MKRKMLSFLAALILLILTTGPSHAAQAGGGKIKAFVSIVPQKYFVDRAGGDYVDAGVLVEEGQSPETYEPTPAKMSQLARSRVFFTIGAPFERVLVPKVAGVLPKLSIIDTSKGVSVLSFAPGSGEQGTDPHIWLDPKRAKIIAGNISEALIKIDPAHGGYYKKSSAAFLKDLDKLDVEIAGMLAPFKGRKVFVFHPAFGYFCESYGLTQVAFEIEGKEPSARQMARLIESMRKENVRTIFVQPQFSQKAAREIARTIGGKVVPIDPLPKDYLTDMRKLALTIKSSLAEQR